MTNDLIDEWPKTVKMYLHGDKDSNWQIGEDIGLSEEAIRENFKYALYEVELDVEVHKDGNIKVIAFDGIRITL